MRDFSDLSDAVIIDVETTGFHPSTDRIVSLSVLLLQTEPPYEEDDRLNLTFNPERPIPREATRVHGIRNRDVQKSPKFAEEADRIRDFIGQKPLIGHNVQFDKRFLDVEFKRAGCKALHANRSYCTMSRFQAMNDGARRGSNLDDACIACGILDVPRGMHDAAEDAMLAGMLAALFYRYDTDMPATEKKTLIRQIRRYRRNPDEFVPDITVG